MDGSIAAAWTGVGLVVVSNLAAVFYAFGRFSAKIDGLDGRVKRIEGYMDKQCASGQCAEEAFTDRTTIQEVCNEKHTGSRSQGS